MKNPASMSMIRFPELSQTTETITALNLIVQARLQTYRGFIALLDKSVTVSTAPTDAEIQWNALNVLQKLLSIYEQIRINPDMKSKIEDYCALEADITQKINGLREYLG